MTLKHKKYNMTENFLPSLYFLIHPSSHVYGSVRIRLLIEQ